MYAIDTTTFSHFLHSLWMLAAGALRLDPAAFQAVENSPGAGLLTWCILFLAGVSETLGQSVVLLVNRVSPVRFIASLLLSGIIFVLSIAIWVGSIWLLGTFLFHSHQPINNVLHTVSLAYAPLLLGFFILLPYVGSLLDHLLDIWCLLAVLVAVSTVFHLQLWQALLCTLLGWIVFEMAKFTIGRPLVPLVRIARQQTAGVPLATRVQDLAQLLTEHPPDRPKGGIL